MKTTAVIKGQTYNVVPSKTLEVEDTCNLCVFCGKSATDGKPGTAMNCPLHEMNNGQVPSCLQFPIYFTA